MEISLDSVSDAPLMPRSPVFWSVICSGVSSALARPSAAFVSSGWQHSFVTVPGRYSKLVREMFALPVFLKSRICVPALPAV